MANSIEISSCVILSIVIAHMLIHGFVEGRIVAVEDKMQLIKHEHAVKTIQNEDGDIIDCVPIYKQPAFDNPLLKNHKIQMRPSSYPKGIKAINSRIEHSQSLLKTVQCPEGTIPILRSQKSSIHPNELIYDPSKSEVAVAYTTGEKYTGLDAVLNVWNPKVEAGNEASGAFIWAQSGGVSNLNTAGAGWMVASAIYGDNRTRFTAFWTKDNEITTGCYNLRCSGFVQQSTNIVLGSVIDPVSQPGDGNSDHMVTMFVHIHKDRSTGNWWLIADQSFIGYWPETIFTNMAGRADELFWGGKVMVRDKNSRHTFTEMGSGHFSSDGYSKSSFIRNLRIYDNNYGIRYLADVADVKPTATNSRCYDIKVDCSKAWGTYFYYGGSGSQNGCN